MATVAIHAHRAGTGQGRLQHVAPHHQLVDVRQPVVLPAEQRGRLLNGTVRLWTVVVRVLVRQPDRGGMWNEMSGN